MNAYVSLILKLFDLDMDAKQVILQMKYARIIDGIAERLRISREEAMARFFHSKTFELIQGGVADLHCFSDRYLIDEFILECNSSASE